MQTNKNGGWGGRMEHYTARHFEFLSEQNSDTYK